MLNTSQFGHLFHGTRAPLEPGDTVLPANKAGVPTGHLTQGDTEENRSGNYAFAIHGSGDHAHTDHDAESYAWSMANRNNFGEARPRVLTVAPAHDIEPGDYHWDNNLEHNGPAPSEDYKAEDHIPEYRSKTGFKVTGVLNTMPGRQGTFPQINWTPFHADRYTVAANHPESPMSEQAIRDLQESVGKRMAHEEDNKIRLSPLHGQGTLF